MNLSERIWPIRLLLIFSALAPIASNALSAQTEKAPLLIAESKTETLDSLPDAPGFSSSFNSSEEVDASGSTTSTATHVAPRYHRYIKPDETAQPLATREKVIFGLSQLRSPFLLLTVATAAGYEQVVNGSPNYGTDSAAYGQRVGAAAIRDGSQTLFSDTIMASLLHEDPRYYIMGNRRNAFVRGGYAITRVFVTRKDDGSATPNYALLSGYMEAAALTNAYYPTPNQGASETFKSFAGSLAGVAVSNSVREFLPDLLEAVHLRK